ncbi:hypothetical protein M8C17_13550 [Micromonospora sp. RHAY321]|uniref:hypothetical protein n=1 Tax=Micromonospora sp. RHAY321 TaxID=2944807 RepID=UPI00207C3620|nr:hypothetical protein [Micromonospora sp. RHAY321]MCO1596189.1 hypothetical protein [Micromonospora sp. RHAY321]
MALVVASALGCGATLGVTAAPAAAAVVAAPTNLTTAGQPCVTAAPGPYLNPERLGIAQAVALQGTFSRTGEGAGLRADFQVWDVVDPAHPQQWLVDIADQSDQVFVHLADRAKQLDGVTYAWRVRILDHADASPWSSTCHFTVDRTAGPAPTVTSAQYPASGWIGNGAIGVPGVFTLTSASDDTVSYRYRFYSSELPYEYVESTVEAQWLGGPATLNWTPLVAGYHSLIVRAVDRAGNWSAPTGHDYMVKETRPSVYSYAYPNSGSNLDYNVGVPGAFTLTTTVADTESFVWRIDGNGPSGSVPAAADGTATATITPTRGGLQTLYVHSVTRDGSAHAPRAYEFLVDNGPTVTGDTRGDVTIGSSLTFHLAPRTPSVEAYLYWPAYSRQQDRPIEKTVVPARADGTADLTWTATETGLDGLRIQSRDADGALSEPRWQPISVDGAAPTVTRTGDAYAGTPSTFKARSQMANIVEYVATLNSDEATKQVLKPAADGSVTFGFTSMAIGHNYVIVVARDAAGVQTDSGSSVWTTTDEPQVTSTDFPTTGTGRLATGTFTFRSTLPDPVGYLYSINSEPYVAIPAQADGTATLTWTPTASGPQSLDVRRVNAVGFPSAIARYRFTITAGPPTVTSVAPATVPAVGVRTITVRGTGLHPHDELQVTPAAGQPRSATVKSVSADGTTMTADVNVAGAPTGQASLTLRPYGAGQPVVLVGALTITPPPPIGTVSPPTITGTVAVGGTVTANPGQWSPTATAYQYQWSANGVPIAGATGATFTIPLALYGKRLTVAVTASRDDYTAVTAVSAPTAAVTRPPHRPLVQPGTPWPDTRRPAA